MYVYFHISVYASTYMEFLLKFSLTSTLSPAGNLLPTAIILRPS